MAIKVNLVKCPECGASLSIEEGRTQFFCSYCGTKVIITNENEYTYRHVNDADVKNAETERLIRLKQLEIEEKRMAAEERARSLKIKLSLLLGAVGAIMMIVGTLLGNATGDPNSGYYMITLVGLFPLLGSLYMWLTPKK